MVPLNEMSTVMRTVKRTETDKQIMMKQWARVKRGIYKNDIAQIVHVDLPQKQIRLKLLPRIDYTQRRDARENKSNTLKRKRNARPTAKLFNPTAIRAIGGKVRNNGEFLIFEQNHYCSKGYVFSLLIWFK